MEKNLRYKEKTAFSHFTILAEGIANNPLEDFECPKGSAVMGIKAWASNSDESRDIIQVIASQIGFEIVGDIQIYETEPSQPPKENPYGYDIIFTPFD
ncbi:hypothetical protein HOH87_04105 [bacterium]|jgi:hypothetical protein|nr:hypothetical protein [bacterium]